MDENNVRYYNLEDRPQNNKDDKPKKPVKPAVIIAAIAVAVLLSGVILTGVIAGSGNGVRGEYITILHISGTIQADSIASAEYSQSWTLEQIDNAIEDDDNQGLILFINTPGGAVYETDEVYMKLLEYKETGKPYYVAMGSQATSGGYYMAAPADKIYANRNCWTGSIGVTMGTFYDISGLLDQYGIETETITAGDNKAMGSMVEPMTDEQREIFQSLVDEAYDQFVGIVAEGRGMTVEEVEELADGRIYTAQQALDNGLIDEIGTLDDALEDMMATYDLYHCSENELIYVSDDFFSTLLAKVDGMKPVSQSDISALVSLMEAQNEMPVMYMCEICK